MQNFCKALENVTVRFYENIPLLSIMYNNNIQSSGEVLYYWCYTGQKETYANNIF
jgi:hypothetical protein